MGQLQGVGIIIECVRLVILGVSVSSNERVQDVNHMMKVMTMLLMMKNKLLKRYHLYPVMMTP